ncbi:glycosyltransferase family 2 protein [Candidatus Electrothrix sp.]|uniref:glycosyltransferase family 2 protein n=1 Tax=Candidatus Electrothrix sp. TaxID=2170559 RepID=UPI004055B433
MKLVIQIPCYNEESTLPITLLDLPKEIEGIDEIEILVIDDGSNDNTAKVAAEYGVHKIVRFPVNKGLARGFIVGLENALSMGADIIVNFDADNQYDANGMSELVKPIIANEADMVIGVRDIRTIKHFSFIKKKLQVVGSWVVRKISNTDVEDVTSGFRAYNRVAAMQLNVFSKFTYTLETIIQAGYSNLNLKTVKIGTNEKLRDSRLFGGPAEYVWRSILTIVRIYLIYQPFRAFSLISFLIAIPGITLIGRFFYFYLSIDGPTGHSQSLVISLIFLALSFNLFMVGVLSELLGTNRRMLESISARIRKVELDNRKIT